MKFGQLLKQYRVNAKLTQTQLGKIIDKSCSYVSDVEHGRRLPFRMHIVSKLEKLFNIKDKSLIKLANKEKHQNSYLSDKDVLNCLNDLGIEMEMFIDSFVKEDNKDDAFKVSKEMLDRNFEAYFKWKARKVRYEACSSGF